MKFKITMEFRNLATGEELYWLYRWRWSMLDWWPETCSHDPAELKRHAQMIRNNGKRLPYEVFKL